jgi:hypothetical protein
MARKVFRTRIGFQDWVVATTSKKAALAAWNVSRDLFRTGDAEQTNDPAAVRAAMANIGKPVAMPAKKPAAASKTTRTKKTKRP